LKEKLKVENPSKRKRGLVNEKRDRKVQKERERKRESG